MISCEQMVITAVVSAAMPDAVAVAHPAISAATRCSSTATVGFEIRV